MTPLKKTVNAIDIGQSMMCYTQRLAENALVSNIGIQPLEEPEKDYFKSVKNGLDDLFKEIEPPKHDIAVSLPAEYAIIKKIPFDSDITDREDLVHWELSQHIISPVEEYRYDYQEIPVTIIHEAHTMLIVGYRSHMIAKFLKLLRSKRLNPSVIDLDVFSLINLVEANYPEFTAAPTLIVFADILRTKIILTLNGTYLDMEIIEYMDTSHGFDSFSIQLRAAIDTLITRFSDSLSYDTVRIFLTGNYFSIPEVTRQTVEFLGKGELLDPFRIVRCTPGMDAQKLKKFIPLIGVSVGLTARDTTAVAGKEA